MLKPYSARLMPTKVNVRYISRAKSLPIKQKKLKPCDAEAFVYQETKVKN